MLQEMEADINIDTNLLVEKYLVEYKYEEKNSNWTIDHVYHESGEYEYGIDCRALFSLIKQIMICEDELYPKHKKLNGRSEIINKFKEYKTE